MEDALTKYPIGEFNEPVDYTIEYLQDRIHAIKVLPGEIRDLVTNRTEQQLNDTYRKGGWTFRQIIHHLADSHLHALIRTKYALTEDMPLVKSFEEADWALLPDYSLPVESSLKVLEGVHLHLAALFESLSEEKWGRGFVHPVEGTITLRKLLGIYAWHGQHHLAHLQAIVTKY